MKIAISGHSGCGNTTATTNVGEALNLHKLNFTFRNLAPMLGISFEQIHKEAEENFIYDYLNDLILIREALKDGVVVGTRLAAWIVDADLRIWLNASLETRAKRINAREPERPYEQTLYKTMRRDQSNRQRYMRLYGIDIDDHGDFDIIINTEQLTASQVSNLIITAAQWAKENDLERKNIHLPRIEEIIAENLQISLKDLRNTEKELDLKDIYAKTKGQAL